MMIPRSDSTRTAQLSTAQPSTAHPSTAQLCSAHPSTAQLSTAQLSTAQLSTAQLSTAQLSTAQLCSAQLRTALIAASTALAVLAASPVAASQGSARTDLPDEATLRAWVEEIKSAERGPFKQIRWFCKDGTVLPPKPYACGDHGGGVQHGEWSDRTRQLRESGFYVANVLVEIDPVDFTGPNANPAELKHILVERFLMSADDGWLFRGARDYRGAIQAEDEEAGALGLVMAMLADPAWRTETLFPVVREAVRLLPLQADEVSAARVRQLAIDVADKDVPFKPLRAKIHNFPDAGDAALVRDWAASKGVAAAQADYATLAEAIDALYSGKQASKTLRRATPLLEDRELADSVGRLTEFLDAASTPEERLLRAARLMRGIRKVYPTAGPPAAMLTLLQASVELEDEAYAAGNEVLRSLATATRRDRLQLLDEAAKGLYGAGLISDRQLQAVRESAANLLQTSSVAVLGYQAELRHLSRVPEWAGRTLAFHFGEAEALFSMLEPKAHLYPQFRLRGSPLLFYSGVVDSLVIDANRLAGIEHELLGQRVGSGLRALNPGLARGTLHAPRNEAEIKGSARGGIYLLPETISELPPVSGILTKGEGSSLSHIQLLARNLGIPNVVVSSDALRRVEAAVGADVVLAVSPRGVVQLSRDGPRWDAVFGNTGEAQSGEPGAELIIRPDLEKLDLAVVDFVSLADLRATDSGRVSGPKGANLGELKHNFGDVVPPGFVIPFGVFRQLLDQPIEAGGPSVFEWMKAKYAEIERLDAQPERQAEIVAAFLLQLRSWLIEAPLPADFEPRLRAALDSHFGADGTYGVFIRSDTNVEDLPGFTGAGLNLTVANVVGYDEILGAMRRVWASPFTERAYSWRQGHMESPEYVFPSVVIQYGFAAEKSGVMVTVDVDSGNDRFLSVAVSEGVGGAVDGQATESLLVDTETGSVQLLAEATASRRTILLPTGGVESIAATGASTLLQPLEIEQLIRFAREVPVRFPTLRSESGEPLPADVEFAFRDGKLALLQMRPFVESKAAQQNLYLSQLDAGLAGRGSARVDLDATPEASQ